MKTKVENLIRKNVKALKPYSSARDDFKGIGDNMVFLDANENPFDSGLNRYPDPNQTEVKVRISELKNISTDQLLIGNGSDEVLDLIVRVFCEPNIDKIMILPPTYGMYRVIAGINAVDVIAVNLDSKFQPKVKEILSAANETTKILFLCSPNNPSGNLMDKTKVEAILNGFEGIVVIDEAYADFSSESSWIQELDRFPNLIVTQTLSKAYGLAGIRLGMCFASPLIILALNKIKPPYNVNALTQREALNKLRDSGSLNKDVDQILTERKLLEQELVKFDCVKQVFPSESNFLLVAIDDAKRRYNELIDMGIVVRDRSSQPGCENCLRFTVGTAEENRTLINALTKLK